MKLPFRAAPKTYQLLSIGQRGVGKTVFLAGTYIDALHHRLDSQKPWWFECQDLEEKAKIDQLIDYIAQTGNYPPPTIKISHFHLSLKRRSLWGKQTRYSLCWQDVPGELCNFDNPEFRATVFSSDGCCIFIDANALLHAADYQQRFHRLMEQLKPIVMLVHLNRIPYPMALLLTKYDLLSLSDTQALEAKLQPLTVGLETFGINYRVFTIAIPIVASARTATLDATGTAQPFLWLGNELENQ